jgi:hypothetical protein
LGGGGRGGGGSGQKRPADFTVLPIVPINERKFEKYLPAGFSHGGVAERVRTADSGIGPLLHEHILIAQQVRISQYSSQQVRGS